MDEVEKWGSRLRAESTKTIYTNAVKNFLRHYHSTAEESMTWEVERAEDHLIEYQEHLLNSGYAGSTTRLMISALRRWFLDHRVRIVMVSRDVPVLKTYLDYIPNREDVQKCLDDLRLHYKVGLALVAFAGLRPSDAVSL